MKFLGHLDVMRFFQKALRRAQLEAQENLKRQVEQAVSRLAAAMSGKIRAFIMICKG